MKKTNLVFLHFFFVFSFCNYLSAYTPEELRKNETPHLFDPSKASPYPPNYLIAAYQDFVIQPEHKGLINQNTMNALFSQGQSQLNAALAYNRYLQMQQALKTCTTIEYYGLNIAIQPEDYDLIYRIYKDNPEYPSYHHLQFALSLNRVFNDVQTYGSNLFWHVGLYPEKLIINLDHFKHLKNSDLRIKILKECYQESMKIEHDKRVANLNDQLKRQGFWYISRKKQTCPLRDSLKLERDRVLKSNCLPIGSTPPPPPGGSGSSAIQPPKNPAITEAKSVLPEPKKDSDAQAADAKKDDTSLIEDIVACVDQDAADPKKSDEQPQHPSENISPENVDPSDVPETYIPDSVVPDSFDPDETS